jgi:hypothetical protein
MVSTTTTTTRSDPSSKRIVGCTLIILLVLSISIKKVDSFVHSPSPSKRNLSKNNNQQLQHDNKLYYYLATTTTSLRVSKETSFPQTSKGEEEGEEFSIEEDNEKSTTKGNAQLITTATSANDILLPDASTSSVPSPSKFRQLKDLMWVRETLEDLTAAEFALSVEQSESSSSSTTTTTTSIVNGMSNGDGGFTQNQSQKQRTPRPAPLPRKKKRAVDYEKLLSQLTKRIEDMTYEPFAQEGDEEGKLDVEDGDEKVSVSFVQKEYTVPVLDDNRGMGRFAYSSKERAVLLE